MELLTTSTVLQTQKITGTIILSPPVFLCLSGYEWVTEPDPLSYSNTGTFDGADVTIDITYTGEVQEIADETPVGCNTIGSLNYVAGTDGSAACYTSLGTFATGGDDQTACDNADTSTTTTLASNDGDTNIREVTGTGADFMRVQGANGWYSDGTNFFRYSNGVQTATGTCPTFILNGLTVNRVGGGAARGERFSATYRLSGQRMTEGTVYIRAEGVSGTGNGFDSQTVSFTPSSNNSVLGSVTINDPDPTSIFPGDTYTFLVRASTNSNFSNSVTGRFTVTIQDDL